VAELCDRLEGLPLALELAAARIALLSPREMLGQLERRFAFLVSRQRDTPARHRTLWAVIEGSYQLLNAVLQRFFARLSVFRGGWTLDAAQAVCEAGEERFGREAASDGGRTPAQALDYLEQLRDCSLLTVEEGGRYRLLETLREYAWEQLGASGERSAAQKRHQEWYLRLAEQADAAAYGPERAVWLTRLGEELDNMRAALAWCQEGAEGPPAPALTEDGIGPSEMGPRASPHPNRAVAEAGVRLARALFWVWDRRGNIVEGLQWLEGALARGKELPASVRAPALFCAAEFAGSLGNREQRRDFLRAAREEYQQVLTRVRTQADRREVLRTLHALAEVGGRQEDWEAAWGFCVEARRLSEELGEPLGRARTLELMAAAPLAQGDLETARVLLEERMAICRTLGDPELLIHALGAMGHVECREGNYARARALYLESMELRWKVGHQLALAQSLEDVAVLAGRQGQMERAIRLLAAAEAFCETFGARPPVADPQEYERTVADARTALGEAGFAAAWAAGRALSLEQAIGCALEERDT
jgi:tetratricopeptide (TPR) repeat protein